MGEDWKENSRGRTLFRAALDARDGSLLQQALGLGAQTGGFDHPWIDLLVAAAHEPWHFCHEGAARCGRPTRGKRT